MYKFLLLLSDHYLDDDVTTETAYEVVWQPFSAGLPALDDYDAALIDIHPDDVAQLQGGLDDVLVHLVEDYPLFVRGYPDELIDAPTPPQVAMVFPETLSREWAFRAMADFARMAPATRTQRFVADAVTYANQTIHHEAALQRILEELHTIVPLAAVNVAVFEADTAVVKYQHGYSERFSRSVMQTQIPLTLPNYESLVADGRPAIVNDTHADPNWKSLPDFDEIRSWLGLPIKKNNVVIGVLNVDSTQPNAFKPYHIQRLQPVMEHIALLLETSQLYDTLDEYTMLLSVLSRQTSLLFASLGSYRTLTEMCRHIAETVVDTFNHTDCGVMLLDRERNVLVRYARAGSYLVRSAGDIRLDGQGLVPEAVRTGDLIYAPDTQKDERYVPNEPNTRSELVVPITAHDEVIGVLDMQSSELHAFSMRDQEGLRAFANYAAMSIQNLQMYNDQRDQAEILAEQVQLRTEELERSKARVESILHHTSEAIVLLGPTGEIEERNPAFAGMMG
ncbi:MAG: GAF domain-containing protein, partial [Chloroflexota bacterium]